jgi:UPF0755 protein
LKYILALGFIAILAFAGFIAATSLTARAEAEFGPPSPALSAFQRWRIGIELGLRADELTQPADPTATPVEFEIGLGEPTGQIVSRLWSADLVSEGNLFSNYLIYTGRDTQLQAGSYQLSAAMSPVQIATALLDPTPDSVTLVILPGWRLEEIAAALPSAGISVTPTDFLANALSTPNELAVNAEMPIGSSLEGFLLPGSYEIPREADAIGLLLAILRDPRFSDEMTPELLAGFDQQGLSVYDALVLASIVEREAVNESEMPLIASVFHNRLAAGMRLEADPTAQYAVGYDAASGSWWKTPLTVADLAIDSPYNTYLYGGLPPGPIAAPSSAALQAVAFPAVSDFYFFQAACDGSGSHVFARTYEEHLENNCP